MGENKRQDIRFIMPSEISPHVSEPLLTICGDLVCFPDRKDMVSKIGILGTKRFSIRPHSCPCCNSEAIMGIEVIGTHDGSLIWQCMKCDERYLRFTKIKTNKLLEKVRDTYTCPDDWGYLPREDFN
jgi:ribosomal protein L37AE/L43A